MTIRLIARELYRLRQQVETLEKEMEAAPSDKRADLERSLQQARAELQQMQKILDGRIDRRS
jgi:phosphoglycerate-specific signal transduction histidine kinase